jgi:glycosidase
MDYPNQEMRLEMISSMKYWVTEANVDGFRCDAADMVPFDFWEQAIDSLLRIDNNLIFLAEGARTDHFEAGFDLNFSWNYYSKLKDLFDGSAGIQSLYSTHQNEYNNVPAGKHRLRFTTNHDESAWDATPVEIFNGKDGALAASVITIFLGGVPMIYSSQEVGVAENVPFFSNAPVNWDLNPDLLQNYQNILQFYSSSNASRKGQLNTYNHSTIAIFKRFFGQEEVLVIANTQNSTASLSLPDELHGTEWINVMDETSLSLDETMELNAYQFFLLKNEP